MTHKNVPPKCLSDFKWFPYRPGLSTFSKNDKIIVLGTITITIMVHKVFCFSLYLKLILSAAVADDLQNNLP
jgi:hypothetical protein